MKITVMQILPRMNLGGVERGVLDLAKFFRKGQSSIKTIVVSGGGKLVEELEQKQIRHYELPVDKKSVQALFLIPKLRRIIDKENVNIVHARSRVPAGISFLASRNSRAHFITTAHGVYKNHLFSKVMGWGKFVICPSKVVAAHMKNIFAVPQEKIVIISRWVDLDKFKFQQYHQRQTSNIILGLGRISPTKGYEHLIKSFRKVVRFNPYLKLRIVGSADKSKMRYFNSLKTLVRRFSLNYNVEFVGFRPDAEKVLAEARILVVPSVIEESFGRVIIEAFAAGVPVIASNVAGFREIIDNGQNGILIEPANSEQIADNILKILADSTYAQNLVNQARKKVENNYNLEECLNQTKKVYFQTLNTLKILVIKISSLGDLILALPSLKEIRNKFPQAQINLLTLKKYQPFLYGCPYLDGLIGLDEDYKRIKRILDISRNLRFKSFDYIVDLQNNRASHLISFLSLPRYSFGYSLRWGFLLTKKIKYQDQDDPLTSQERILQFLGVRFKEKKLVFWSKQDISAPVLDGANFIGINVSASSRWQSKNWSSQNISQLIELINKNLPLFKTVLLGDQAALPSALKIEKYQPSRLHNLCGKTTLSELPQIMRQLKVFISPDTASLHLALALGIPTIALFGPTEPKRHTVKTKDLYIFCEKLPCSYCYQPKCKIAQESVCLDKITPQMVFNKVKEIVGE